MVNGKNGYENVVTAVLHGTAASVNASYEVVVGKHYTLAGSGGTGGKYKGSQNRSIGTVITERLVSVFIISTF